MTVNSCVSCKWWTPGVVYEALDKSHQIFQPGICKRFPAWESTNEMHYCGEHRPKDDPILNPHE